MDSLQPHLAAARNNSIRFSAALSQQSRLVEPLGHPKLDRLTSRQREILAQLSSGCTNAQIALALDISVGTVRKHVEHILRRLDVPTRTAAAVCYIAGSAPTQRSLWTASISAMLSDRDGIAAPAADDADRSGCDDGAGRVLSELAVRPAQ
jgi:DNA-binding CsgD family transcriptional regulator